MKPAPDFWAGRSTDALLALPDRLNRKNLPMFYHFSYDQYYHAGSPVVPSVSLSPEPQYRNNPYDLEARLRVLRESTGGGNKALAPEAPSPDDPQAPAAVRIHKLPSVYGIVAIGDL